MEQLRTNPRVVDEIVRFVVHDLRAASEGDDVMVAIVKAFPNAGDSFDGAINRCLMLLREFVRQDDIERALVEPKAEVQDRPKPASDLKGKRPARPAPAAQMDLFQQVKGDRHG
jgi:hypothetical protein